MQNDLSNEQRFTGKAGIYNKFRSSYPKAMIDYLYSAVGFGEDSVVADVGSGTGIFSRLLLEAGSRVIGVEPNDDMRGIAENELGGKFEKFTSIKASAEHTGLPDGSVDFVTAAQAFHWFDAAAFKIECRRVLKPAGRVVLVYNSRDYESEFIKKDFAIRKKYCVDTKGLAVTDIVEDELNLFFENGYEKKIFNNDLILSKEAYVGMNLSRSYSPRENEHPVQYNGLVNELQQLFDEYRADGTNGTINFPQYTIIYIGS